MDKELAINKIQCILSWFNEEEQEYILEQSKGQKR